MKTVSSLFLLACPLTGLAQSGGPWSIKSSTQDGGGQRSTGGGWTLTGTIGQPEAAAAPATGGPFAFAPGFWPGTAPSADPSLTIAMGAAFGVPGTARVEWSASAVGRQLQYTDNLSTWTDYGSPITGPGSIYFGLNNGPRYYFRLRKP